YVAEKEESIHSIAQLNGIQLSYLLKYNDLKGDETIKAGTKILLRETNDKADIKNIPVNASIHEVQPKEGLYAISKKYNVSVQDLRQWNGLISDDLRIGQKLIIAK
ncbi:MAG: LysM peptidoglycan-binding domain-containing protein, partial [Ferruginibacter sp.]